jgi:threonine/homoserine/homoserine lactone efflux protein
VGTLGSGARVGLNAQMSIAAPVGPLNVLRIRRTNEKGWKSGMVSGLGAALAFSRGRRP